MTSSAATIRGRLRSAFVAGPSRGGGAWSRWWPPAAALAIAFATWPVGSVTPTNGLDPSWRIALHMAVARGIDFGDIAFTYGPLGFLEAPVNAEAHTLVPAFAWIALLQVGLAYLVIESVRRTLSWPVALVVAFVSCQLLDEGREVLPLIAFLWAALVVQWGVPYRAGRALLPVSGFVAGMGLLVKFNEGVIALALVGVAAWWLGPRRWRAIGVLGASALAGVVVPWVALGNGIGGLPRWTLASVRLASGYSAGLPYEMPGRAWEYPLFIVLVSTIAWFAWVAFEDLGRARRIGMALIGVIIVFSLFKRGFVRHDLGHSGSTFTALIAVAAGVRWSPRLGRLVGVGVCAATIAAALFVYGADGGRPVRSLLDPAPRIETATDHLRLAFSPSRRAREREDARRDLRALFAMPGEVARALRGHTVHVEPYETAVIWAYGLGWRPVPVFQAYSIYTNALDRGNADMLGSGDAPERIVRRGEQRIDGHSPEGEGPEQLKAMICDYVQQLALPGWQVLRRVPPRCGSERVLASVTGHAGEVIPVPAAPSPEDMVMARVDLPWSLGERLRAVLYKPRRLPEAVLGEGYGYRIPGALLAGPLLMRVPASVGWADYATGFQFDSLRLSYVASPFRVDFVAVRVAPSSAGG